MKSELKFFRKMKDVTQADIARATGIDFTIISRIETGILRGTQEQKEKIAEFLEVKTDVLFPQIQDKK